MTTAPVAAPPLGSFSCWAAVFWPSVALVPGCRSLTIIAEGEVVRHKALEDISDRMAGIDIAILSTHTENGQIANRPMSNNGDVNYDGTSYYFTFEHARTVADIEANNKVALVTCH
jgi:hypothetical protein